MFAARLCLFVVLLCQQLSAVRAFARSPDADAGAGDGSSESAESPPADYTSAADLGFLEFQRGNYAEARARFLHAHALWPSARTLRALGHCEFELGRYTAAAQFLRQALASTARPLTEEQRRSSESLLQRSLDKIARYQIVATPELSRVLVDGIEREPHALHALLLQEGRHVIEVSAPGYMPQRREVRVQGRVHRVVRVDLQPQPPPPLATEVPLRRKWWLWTGVAAIAVAGGVAAVALGTKDPGVAEPTPGTFGPEIVVRP
jgi:hypothetical protein